MKFHAKDAFHEPQKSLPTLSRRVSDEVFDESFCEFFIPTEDCSTAAKLTGLGNTRKLFKMESFRGPQQA